MTLILSAAIAKLQFNSIISQTIPRIENMNLFKIDPDKNFFKDLLDTFFKTNKINNSNLLDYIFVLPSQQAIDLLKREFLNRSIYLLPDIFSLEHIPQEKIINL